MENTGSTSRPESLWTLCDVSNQGKGRIATGLIPRGTLIMTWQPSFKIKPPDQTHVATNKDLVGCLPMVIDSDNDHAHKKFLRAARINHACDSNAQHYWNSNLQCFTLHAVRDIHPGDEITTNYLCGRAAMPYELRRETLRDEFNFWCGCRLCSLPEQVRLKVDELLQEIDRGRKRIMDGNLTVSGTTGMRVQLYKLTRYQLALAMEQGINNNFPAMLYLLASNIMYAAGDVARGIVYIRRAQEEFIVQEGTESRAVQENRILLNKPTSFSLFGIDEGTVTVKRTSPDDIPPGLTFEEMERWLWDPVPGFAKHQTLKSLMKPLGEHGSKISAETSEFPDSRSPQRPGIYISVYQDVILNLRNRTTFPVFSGLPHEAGRHLNPYCVSTRRNKKQVGGEVTRARSRPNASSPGNRSRTRSRPRRRSRGRDRSAGGQASTTGSCTMRGGGSCISPSPPPPPATPPPVEDEMYNCSSSTLSSAKSITPPPRATPPPVEQQKLKPKPTAKPNPFAEIQQPKTAQFQKELRRYRRNRITPYRLEKHYALLGEIVAVVNLSRLEIYVRDMSGELFPLSFWTNRKGAEFTQKELDSCVGKAIVVLYPERYTSIFKFRQDGIKIYSMDLIKILPISLNQLMDLNDRIQEHSAIDLTDRTRKCHNCGIRQRNLWCCKLCNLFFYCSWDCRVDAWRKCHREDCRFLKNPSVKGMFMFNWVDFGFTGNQPARFPLKHREIESGERVVNLDESEEV